MSRVKQDKYPKYIDMIQAAVINLQEVNGSTRQSIQKYICSNYAVENRRQTSNFLDKALKTGVKNGILIPVKGSDSTESFRLGERGLTVKQSIGDTSQLHMKTSGPAVPSCSKTKTESGDHEVIAVDSVPLHEKIQIESNYLDKTSVVSVCEGVMVETEHFDNQKQSDGPNETEQNPTSIKESSASSSKDYSKKTTKCLSKLRTVRTENMCVKIPSDKNDCEVFGLDVTPDGRVIVADKQNGNIKMFDEQKQFMTSYIVSWESLYFFIAVIDNEELVVSLSRDKKLLILLLNPNKIKARQTIRVKEPMASVSTFEDKIIALAFTGSTVNLLNRKGNILWSKCLDANRASYIYYQLVFRPLFNTSFFENKKPVVIVTDLGKSKIIKLDGGTGDVIMMYDLEAGKMPVGVTSDSSGILYVCCRNSREICALTSDLQAHKILISQIPTDGVWFIPSIIKYNGTNSQLLMSNEDVREKNALRCYIVVNE